MKLKFSLVFFLLFFISYSILHAQKNVELNNMAKLNVSSLAFKSIHLQYERKIGKRTTLALGYSTIPTGSLAFQSFYEKQINNPRINISDFKLGTSILTPEFRYYYGKKGAFHGFYMAAYVRFGNYHIEGPISYNSTTDSTKKAVFDGNIKMISGGILLGSSFVLSKNLYLDWWIAGGSLGTASGRVSAASDLHNPDDQDGLKKALNSTSIPLTHIENEVTATGATVTSTGTVVGIRGLGINIGFRF